MPKVTLTEADRMRDRLATVIRVEMARQGTTTAKVAEKMDINRCTMQYKVQDPGRLTVRELGQLVRMLRIPQEELMEAIYGR